MDVQEIWKPLPGFEGYYEISNMGKLRSMNRTVNHSHGGTALKLGKEIKLQQIWSGYQRACVSRNGKPSSVSIHRAVCEAFHGEPPSPIHHAAHLNGVRNDNRASNLAWKTPSENEADKKIHGTANTGDHVPPEKRPRGESHGMSKLNEAQVRLAHALMHNGFISTKQAAVLMGISSTQAKDIRSAKTWRHVLDEF